ncbi:glycosyltransferase family 2 protein [Niabella insulamsoli]|uniref:glycosyltransferase family 2 protein n=1 Tax=Niabella insulamsoli TaxID=3144874 RepID=UPI0031FDE58E
MLWKKTNPRPAVQAIEKPTRRELLTLQILIVLGIAAMVVFLRVLFQPDIAGSRFLFILLLVSCVFGCLKVLHEWYHYFFITVPDTPPNTQAYTVDIFTTFCAGEPYEMIVETLTAIQKISYPHQTYLCDEANDPYLIEVCKQLGVNHVTRTLKINAKAGNINNALRTSHGDLCVILDPDHVPQPNFLDPIISHFNDPKIGFVQIVQAYKNENESLIAKGAAQQTYQFYGPIMMTMNKYGTVLAIGANCTFRRKALDSIGGHSAGLAEDMNTAMHLHAKGWKSVYVPQVLALGLVPSTLSAYYKQQLKWARGVFELLVTTYVSNFRKFTLLQKIHYGTIPLYYLSGIIFLINFLIPIFSLVSGTVPINLGLQTFALAALPYLVLVILIRHYVQKWVTKDEERGFHVVGGLIAIGTWWIFILGFVYTILRKKVPYVPTPKDANEADNWPLHIPNIAMLFLTIGAVVYGLYQDFNPYLLFMAGLAAINCLILLFNIAAGRQLAFRKYKNQRRGIDKTIQIIGASKKKFWLLRRRLYAVIRSYPVIIISIMLCGGSFYLYQKNKAVNMFAPRYKKPSFMLNGIFAPTSDNGQSNLAFVEQLSATRHQAFNIISLYVPWGDGNSSEVPMQRLDSIYSLQGLPMITWEPWQNLFIKRQALPDQNVFQHIISGDYDTYITAFADSLKNVKHPVFLRFAHEPDNPFYPWSASGNNSATDFKKAWIYLHNSFKKREANNVIWVWNIWKPESTADYFPGKKYVDWASVNILNYGKFASSGQSFSFEQLYRPFRKHPVFRSTIPVMIAEMGSLDSGDARINWTNQAIADMQHHFPEVKAFVLFQSGSDHNIPEGSDFSKTLDWRQPIAKLDLEKTGHYKLSLPVATAVPQNNKALPIRHHLFSGMKGVNYNRTLSWANNYNPVFKRDIIKDFAEIKKMGANTIKISPSGIYNRNLFTAAKANGFNIIYSFWTPDEIDFIKDRDAADQLSKEIIGDVKRLKSNPNIIGWNIGNSPYIAFEERFDKPFLLYQQAAYLSWLSQLISQIKSLDAQRPVSCDLPVNDDLLSIAPLFFTEVPQLDYLGLICDARSPVAAVHQLQVPFYFSKIDPQLYLQNADAFKTTGAFMADWQNQHQWNYLTFDGLKDFNGNAKNELAGLAARWGHIPSSQHPLPRVKILQPAAVAFSGETLKYNALIFKDTWQLAKNINSGLAFEWFLVKNDSYGNPLSMAPAGSGPEISIKIPSNAKRYSLYLQGTRAGRATTWKTGLGMPLK